MTGKVKAGIQALSQVCNLLTEFSELKVNTCECHNSPKEFYCIHKNKSQTS